MHPQDITAEALRATLLQALQPSQLEVLDESAAHAGHAGANGSGYGTHFRVRIASVALTGKSRVTQHRLVLMPCANFWTPACMRWQSKSFRNLPRRPLSELVSRAWGPPHPLHGYSPARQYPTRAAGAPSLSFFFLHHSTTDPRGPLC